MSDVHVLWIDDDGTLWIGPDDTMGSTLVVMFGDGRLVETHIGSRLDIYTVNDG